MEQLDYDPLVSLVRRSRSVDGRAGVGRDDLFEDPRPSGCGRRGGALRSGGSARRAGSPSAVGRALLGGGTLIEPWASMKSFRRKDGGDDDPPAGRNAERDFRGERRSNATHASVTDPDARRHRKREGQSSRLYYAPSVDGEPERAERRCGADRCPRLCSAEPLQLPEPDLFVYTCLDDEYEPWHEDEVLHEDYGTLVKCRSATEVRLDRQLVPWAKVRGSARFGSDPSLHGGPDGHILDVEVLSLRGMGNFRRTILYLRYENNHSWDALFGSGWHVELKYVCATREGLGMGGCAKSVLDHIYKEGRIEAARRIGVDPQYVITWCDYTDEMFRRAASRYYPKLRRIAPYIPEDECETDHWIYRMWTPPWLASTTLSEERHVGQVPSYVRPLDAALLGRGPVWFS